MFWFFLWFLVRDSGNCSWQVVTWNPGKIFLQESIKRDKIIDDKTGCLWFFEFALHHSLPNCALEKIHRRLFGIDSISYLTYQNCVPFAIITIWAQTYFGSPKKCKKVHEIGSNFHSVERMAQLYDTISAIKSSLVISCQSYWIYNTSNWAVDGKRTS